MASTLTGIADLAQHPEFLRRVRAATVKAAVAVGNEPNDQTQRALQRRALAQNALHDSDQWADPFAWACARNPVITLDSADSDLEFTVSEVWDAIAGADPPAEP